MNAATEALALVLSVVVLPQATCFVNRCTVSSFQKPASTMLPVVWSDVRNYADRGSMVGRLISTYLAPLRV